MDIPRYGSLDGQVALVTGANRGIGREIAAGLDDLGATVYAGSRSQSSDVPDGCEQVLLDVTQEGDIEARSASTSTGRRPGDDIVAEPTERIDRTLGVNLRGPMLLCKHAVPLLLQHEGGRVVNVSSGMGAITDMDGGSPAYRVSKTGLNGLTAYLHGEYAENGLLANAACPGWVHTDMGGEEAPRSPAEGADTPVWLATFEPGAPSGRFWRDREPIEW